MSQQDDTQYYRPIPVAQIENDRLRRTLMVSLFIPIMIIGWVVIIIYTIYWFVKSIIRQPRTLYKGLLLYWDHPRDDFKG